MSAQTNTAAMISPSMSRVPLDDRGDWLEFSVASGCMGSAVVEFVDFSAKNGSLK